VPVTARPYHVSPPLQESFTWTFPGGPLRINIPLELIARLQTEIDEHYSAQANTSRSEVGGVLLGREGISPDTLEIEDYIRVPSGTGDGQYAWSATAFKQMGRPNDEMRSVGYFRTESGDTLTLRDEDLDAVQEHFPDRNNVVLLIQGSGEERNAGFLFWDGDAFTPFSFLNFPFDAEVLKREASERSADPPVESEEAEIAFEKANESALEKIEKVPVRISTKTLWMVWAAVLGLAAGVTIWGKYYLRPPFGSNGESSNVTDSLQLEVAPQANGINIRWNPRSKAVRQARDGLLIVLDGDREPQIVLLSMEQLKNGHVYYEPSAERTEFRLEVSDDAGNTFKESVIVLSSRAQLSGRPDAFPAATSKNTRRPVRRYSGGQGPG